MPLPRLRQVALAARELKPVAAQLRGELGLGEPYHDPGIGDFGLENAVFSAGDTFLEIVSPVKEGTTAGRYLDKRGGDAGYMAIFQVANMTETRRRIEELGIRVVWKADLDDISGTHLHPKDVPGAIVSVDSARPEETWHWAGPEWTGTVPDHGGGGIESMTVRVTQPEAAAARWGSVLGLDADGPVLVLDGARQEVRFVETDDPAHEGIVEVVVTRPEYRGDAETGIQVGGVVFRIRST